MHGEDQSDPLPKRCRANGAVIGSSAIDLIQEATPIRTTADRIALLLQTVRAIQARRAFDWQAQLRLGFGSQFQCLFAFNCSSLRQKKSFDPEFCGEPLGRLTRSQDQDAKPNSPARLTPRINPPATAEQEVRTAA